jgi:hypothetical protein
LNRLVSGFLSLAQGLIWKVEPLGAAEPVRAIKLLGFVLPFEPGPGSAFAERSPGLASGINGRFGRRIQGRCGRIPEHAGSTSHD